MALFNETGFPPILGDVCDLLLLQKPAAGAQLSGSVRPREDTSLIPGPCSFGPGATVSLTLASAGRTLWRKNCPRFWEPQEVPLEGLACAEGDLCVGPLTQGPGWLTGASSPVLVTASLSVLDARAVLGELRW